MLMLVILFLLFIWVIRRLLFRPWGGGWFGGWFGPHFWGGRPPMEGPHDRFMNDHMGGPHGGFGGPGMGGPRSLRMQANGPVDHWVAGGGPGGPGR